MQRQFSRLGWSGNFSKWLQTVGDDPCLALRANVPAMRHTMSTVISRYLKTVLTYRALLQISRLGFVPGVRLRELTMGGMVD
jgi:hypothetical protein